MFRKLTTETLKEDKKVIIMSFENLSDRELQYFSKGLMHIFKRNYNVLITNVKIETMSQQKLVEILNYLPEVKGDKK